MDAVPTLSPTPAQAAAANLTARASAPAAETPLPTVVRLNVGGYLFATTRETLLRVGGTFFRCASSFCCCAVSVPCFVFFVFGAFSVLSRAFLGRMFCSGLLGERMSTTRDETGAFFIDRDGQFFGPILTFLRTGEVQLPSAWLALFVCCHRLTSSFICFHTCVFTSLAFCPLAGVDSSRYAKRRHPP